MRRFFCGLTLFFALSTSGCESPTVDFTELEKRNGLYYKIGADQPFSGKAIERYENGKKKIEGSFKEGAEVGIWILWDQDGNQSKGYNFDEAKYRL